jgi:hypothetical protein
MNHGRIVLAAVVGLVLVRSAGDLFEWHVGDSDPEG